MPEDVQDQVEVLSEQAEEAMEQGRYEEELDLFNEALSALPEPREIYEAYVWLKASMGDACFHSDRFEDGLDHFYEAYTTAGPENVNPFIVYRLGQIYRQLQDEDNAVDFFIKAYLTEGESAFEDEDDLVYLRNRVALDGLDDDDEDYDDDDHFGGRNFDDEGFSRGYIPPDDYEDYTDD